LVGLILGAPAFCAETGTGVIDRVVERTFAASDHASISLETFYGPVKVFVGDPSSPAEIKILVREAIDADTDAEADRELRHFELSIEEEQAGRVRVKARDRRAIRWSWQKWPPIGLSFEVTVPARCDVKIFSHEGAVVVPGVTGSVDASTDSGSITMGAVNGDVRASARRGDIAITAASGALEVSARSGNIMIGRADGPAEIRGVGGTIEIQRTHGRIRVVGDGSDLKVGFSYPFLGDAEVVASGGDIVASFEEKLAASLRARASTFGEVRGRDLKMEITRGGLGKSSLEAVLNGGGPRVSLTASGGNIRLLSVP
jgi:hypothetical protein